MEPPSYGAFGPLNLVDLAASIEQDILSLESLNRILPSETPIFNTKNYTFSGEQKKKGLNLYLPTCKALQDISPSSPKKILANLSKLHERINRDIIQLQRCILRQVPSNDLEAIEKISKQLPKLKRELTKSISTDQGINSITRDFKKQSGFSDSVKQVIATFKLTLEDVEAIEDNLKDVITQSMNKNPKEASAEFWTSSSFRNDPLDKLPVIIEEEDIGEDYEYTHSLDADNFPEEPEDDELEDDFEENKISTTYNDDLSLEDDDNWLQHIEIIRAREHALSSLESLSEIGSPPSKMEKNTDLKKTQNTNLSPILPIRYKPLKTSPIGSWMLIDNAKGQRFCLIKISQAAFAKIPLTGKYSTSLEAIKKKYGLLDKNQIEEQK